MKEGEGGIMGNSTDAAEVKMQYSDMFKVIIIFEGNVQKVFKTKGKKNITDLQNKLTSTKGKDVLATVLNPTGRGGDCSYSEHVPYSLAHPFINLADYRVDEGYTSNGYIIGDIIYTNKIISVTILQLPAKRIPEGDGEI